MLTRLREERRDVKQWDNMSRAMEEFGTRIHDGEVVSCFALDSFKKRLY